MGRILPNKDYRLRKRPAFVSVLNIVLWSRFGFLECFCGR